ncbi:MAG: cytochrome c [Deinococcales bacterium]
MRRLSLWGAVLFLALLGAGVALGQTGGTTASSNAPASSTASSHASTPVQIGAQLYAANCQTCHGKDGNGGKDRGIRGMNRISFSRFKSLILYGRERMPGYLKTGLSTSNNLGSLGSNGYLGNSKAPTDQQIQDLLAYLRTLPGASRGGFFGGDD